MFKIFFNKTYVDFLFKTGVPTTGLAFNIYIVLTHCR